MSTRCAHGTVNSKSHLAPFGNKFDRCPALRILRRYQTKKNNNQDNGKRHAQPPADFGVASEFLFPSRDTFPFSFISAHY